MEKKKLKVGDYIAVRGRQAQIDKILPDGTMYVITEDVVDTPKGPTNYFKIEKQWRWVIVAQ